MMTNVSLLFNILVLDDDASVADFFRMFIQTADMDISCVQSWKEAEQVLENELIHVLFLDIKLGGNSPREGLDILKHVSARYPEVKVIMITNEENPRWVLEAWENGAVSLIFKPLSQAKATQKILNRLALIRAEFDSRVRTAINIAELEQTMRNRLPNHIRSEIIIESPEMLDCLKRAIRYSNRGSNIFITGERGCGKKILAQLIHNFSNRADKLFVHKNMAAIPETMFESEIFGHVKGSFTGAERTHKGIIEQANGGFCFLDEIDSLTPAQQVKLNCAIEDKIIHPVGSEKPLHIDVIFLSATSKDLAPSMKNGSFRPDLYDRISQLKVHIPALRDRKKDIIPLFMQKLNQEFSRDNNPDKSLPKLPSTWLKQLENYTFPGNIRELENIVKAVYSAFDESKTVNPLDYYLTDTLPEKPAPSKTGALQSVESMMKSLLTNLGPTKVAAALNVSRQAIYDWTKRNNIDIKDLSGK
jgi:DNA-binding NtrC family response regulator